MRTLITGGKGFIGTHLHKLVPKADILDIKNDSNEDIRTCNLNTNYTHIFHLAALRSAPLGEEYPEDFISTNCWGTVRLLKRYPNARFMNVTSASANNPKGVYGATKKFSDIMGSLYPNVVNVRPYNVFGEGQSLESGAVIPRFINAMIKGEKPIVYGDGSQIRDYTYVGDLVTEMVMIMFQTEYKGTCHCGYSNGIDIMELLRLIYGYRPEVSYQPERPFDIKRSVSPYKMKSSIDHGRLNGLKKTIGWWKNEISIST